MENNTIKRLEMIKKSIELTSVNNEEKIFDTIEELKKSTVKVGDVVYTLGYYKKGDGGGYVYEIVNDASLDTEVINIQLNNGLKAKYGLNLNLYDINVLTVGIKKNDKNAEEQNSFIMEKILVKYNRRCKLFFPGGEYFISNINFTRKPVSNADFEINLYGEFSAINRVSNGGNRTLINTLNKDFICDRRGLLETAIVKGLNIYMKDLFIISDEYADSTNPNGICFGQPKGTPLANQEVNFHFENVKITGFEYGVRSPHWSCGASGGKDIVFNNCICGIYVGQAMHCFDADRISFNEWVLGIDTGWGGVNARITNVHISTGYLGSNKADFDEYVGILSRGNFTIDALYYEPYNNNGYMDRCILIKHEGYAFGIGALYIKNTDIGYPGSGNTGKFLKSDCYLGFGFSRGVENPTKIPSWNDGHYPYGAVIFENCKRPYYIDALKNMISINTSLDTETRKYSNIWWGYDFDGWEFSSPDLLVGLKPFIKGRGYITSLTGYSGALFKEICFDMLSDVNTMYLEDAYSFEFKRNLLYPEFVRRNSIDRFTYEYDISLTINGTISSSTDVTIGIFAQKDFDGSTLRLIKKIKTIKPNEVYNEYEKHIKFELNAHYDLLDTENKIYLGYISNTGSKDSLLTSEDRQIIEYDFTIRKKDFLGYK